MPFAQGAEITFENSSQVRIDRLAVKLDVEPLHVLPGNWGRLHATQLVAPAATAQSPHTGPLNVPVHEVLNRAGRGKYVGVLLYVDWRHKDWWGEGDWQIWTDESAWPPSYHGTGSEEYFNSGWCAFDRKAISGYVSQQRPGEVAVYSFHLNDAFQFQKNIRVVEEQMGCGAEAEAFIHQGHPRWGSTAFWYSADPAPAKRE
jgi:hypothetical protein